MAGRSSDDTVSPMPPISPGGVLMVAFVAPKSYAATSYPHPIKEAKAANPDETRDIALYVSKNYACQDSRTDVQDGEANRH